MSLPSLKSLANSWLSSRRAKRRWSAIALLSLASSLILLLVPASAEWHLSSNAVWHGVSRYVLPQPAHAQRLNPRNAAQQIYAQMPELPLEDHYERVETGEVDSDNTLLSRFIRYHLYVQGRSPLYRLDWKITLADYLGVNEWMRAEQYPSASDLAVNPRDADIAAIQQLNRAQRDALVQALVDLYRGDV
jgi:hypothetical protein